MNDLKIDLDLINREKEVVENLEKMDETIVNHEFQRKILEDGNIVSGLLEFILSGKKSN